MSIRIPIAVSGLALLAALPFAAYAGAGARAADACVDAFVSTYVPKDRAVRVRIVEPAASPVDFFARRYTFALSASLHNGEEFVTARCVANARGEVVVLDNPVVLASAKSAVKLR
ncbi:MAG TPA: hypothetical protein VKB34_17240 [Povalibacter sp.]|nr:hypothetical protein [Povalibacter sp.]